MTDDDDDDNDDGGGGGGDGDDEVCDVGAVGGRAECVSRGSCFDWSAAGSDSSGRQCATEAAWRLPTTITRDSVRYISMHLS